MTQALRTPDERFSNLPDFPWPPHYAQDLPGYQGLRAAWIDEGPKDAPASFLCLHGEPTWSFLYRKMAAVFLGAGGRVVAPDFFGFGRSDKPTEEGAYGFHFHRNHVLRLVERLDLQEITLVVQDWGGLIGLTLPLDPGFRRRLKRLIVMNTTLAAGETPSAGFAAWRAFVAANPEFDVAALMKRAAPMLSDAEAAAYGAPFPDPSYMAGVRAFPQLVMTEPGMEGVEESRAALAFWSREWEGPTFMAVGAQDPVLGPDVMARLRTHIRGCPEPMMVADGGHFLQEWGGPIAEAALASFGGA